MPRAEQVAFAGDAAKLAGHLFLPDGAGSAAAPVPGVVVAGT